MNSYVDDKGNIIKGDINPQLIDFQGCNSIVDVGNGATLHSKISMRSNVNVKIGNYTIVDLRDGITCENDSSIELSDNVEIITGRRIRLYKSSKIKVGDRTKFRNDIDITAFDNSRIDIGNDGMFVSDDVLLATANSEIIIGNEFLASWRVSIVSGDGHAIFDVNSGKRINSREKVKIKVNDHVWAGCNVSIFDNAEIGTGSVIGEGAFVDSKIPNNVVVVGRPSRIIRENISWSRNWNAKTIDECGLDYVNITNTIK